eukprot:TRINITY_DN1923_c0_g1_i1.p1 TRINITY_DN1923_c0_g1~~TRINITY_DN1923_c0_g1_i1.p1  ORF type:complete len:1205 (+),score=349.53 TRINITY_DN1923_c0_g1_i1:90-3704(+)
MDPLRMLSKRHAFGVKADVKDNIHYIDDTTVAFPVGRNVVIYNTQSNTQKFIPGAEKTDAITAMALSPNKKYIAVAESGENPAVAIYDTTTRKRRKVLNVPDLASREFVCLAFSSDGRHLATQGGYPEWNLVYWNWERSKALSMVQVAPEKQGAQDKQLITQCSINPRDPQHICVTGNGLFKFFRYSDGQLKLAPGGLGKRDPQNFLCHVWLPPDDRIVVSTDNGDLLLIENSEFKCTLPLSPSDTLSIDTIVAYSKGFICGGDMGLVSIFEKSDDKELYRKVKTMKVDQRKEAETGIENDSMKIKSFSLTQQEEYLALCTSNNQLFVLNLSNADFSKAEDAIFEPLAQQFHSAPITGLSTCIRKPLVATCSKDKTIRIWNYIDHTLEIIKSFPTEANSIAMHPSGLHVLVGFSDKLRFMNLYGDDIREFKSFPIRACPECKFSNGGQYFAAVHGNIIHIYNTYTCDTIGHLRGHNAKVRCIHWQADDTRLVSVGMDGAVHDWVVKECRKENDNVQKSINYTAVVADSKNVWAVGSDRKLRELDASSLHPIQDYDTGDYPLTTLALAQTHRMLFGGSDDGSVRVYTFPLQAGVQEQSLAHAAPISRIALTFDETVLFTAGEDCTLYVYDVKDKDGRSTRREVTFAEEILISKADLEEKNTSISELKAKVEELKLDMDYQQRRREIKHEEKIKELTDAFKEEMEKLAQKHDQLLALKNEQEINFAEIRRDITEKHRAETGKLEIDYQAQIQASEEQIAKLKKELEAMKKDFLAQLTEKDLAMDKLKKEMEENHQEALSMEKEMNEALRVEQKELVREHEEIRRQLDEDIDLEIEDIKEKYEKRLQAEREQFLHLKGENGIMRKKFNSLQKDILEKKEEIQTLFDTQKQLDNKIKGLEKDIEALKNEIKERDETIGDKEKRIYDLKKKNQELEKFKFVLDYKIRELKSQIEPRQEEITQAKLKIKEMDGELERYHQNNLSLVLTINDLKLKIEGQQKEIHNLSNKLKDAETYKTRIRNDLAELANIIQDPKALKEAVKKLYQKHVREKVSNAQEMEEDLQKEYNRQRDYLEKTVESLKRKLVKDADGHKQDTNRIMNENVILIREINELRREIKMLRSATQVAKLEKDPTSGSVSSAREEGQREIEMQRLEIHRLRQRVDELERQLHARGRPTSSERLPPMEGFESGAPVTIPSVLSPKPPSQPPL